MQTLLTLGLMLQRDMVTDAPTWAGHQVVDNLLKSIQEVGG